ncbi:MAG: ubiquinone biosynthesis regulatory protein kinase UbiB [Gammaproteobacteria bacterium TMED78]|nr:MAG: ubiquinone biosynthesis regulatory protein kinase UbiB [Gammaproteobacteria bacterium TMED78]|tara:strand:+ start:118609 stop:120237 length:1629 start_codon:yes stop_codon:yes gene_type:complete
MKIRMKFSLLIRIISIHKILYKYGLDLYLWRLVFRPFANILSLVPRKKNNTPLGIRIRKTLEELGPIFVKFGQAVSTRGDFFPIEIINELVKLQDKVPPFDSEESIKILEAAYNSPVEEVFEEFIREPLAAASVAQVHLAKMKTGQEVVVKILRPGVKGDIKKDIDLLYLIASIVDKHWKDGRRLRLNEVVDEFDKTLNKELDLMLEASNANQLRRNFDNSDMLYVPKVYWDYCRSNIMVMERVKGIPISDIDELKRSKTNIKKLAENGVEIFFTQVFRDNFFHADMHPGNIFIDNADPQNPRYVAIDFGIVGSLSRSDQHYLAGNFLAFFNNDYYRVAKLHVDSGWVPANTRVDEFEAAIRSVCEPIFNKPLKDISFGLVLLRLFDTARRFDMRVQPQLVLLQKTLLNIEGLGRQLYPDLDLWQTAKPYLESWMKERTSIRSHIKDIAKRWPGISEDFIQLFSDFQIYIKQSKLNKERMSDSDLMKDHRHVESVSLEGRVFPAMIFFISGFAWLILGLDPNWIGYLIIGIGVLSYLIKFRK